MNERRQRARHALIAGLLVLAVLGVGSGCGARSSVEGAQTAVALAQTALPGVQTVLPGVQATAQAGAGQVSTLLGDPSAIVAQVRAVLAGASVEVTTTPQGTTNDAVTRVDITATDTGGSYTGLDGRARQAAAAAALLLVGQYYPNATVILEVVDGSGARLGGGTRAPGQAPAVDSPQ